MFDMIIVASEMASTAAPSLGGPADIWAAIVKDFSNIGSPAAMTAFLQVLMIDIVLAGDNAIVVGALAAGLPAEQRKKVIFIGVIAALVLRVIFALMVTWLLGIVGLVFAGGVLLLWVAWKMYRDITRSEASESPGSPEIEGDENSGIAPARSFAAAAWAVAIADVSMSLDNVLAVAGAAREHPTVLVFGLALSIALMGLAATVIARLLHRYYWIAYVGLAIILYVAFDMIYRGGLEVWPVAKALAGSL